MPARRGAGSAARDSLPRVNESGQEIPPSTPSPADEAAAKPPPPSSLADSPVPEDTDDTRGLHFKRLLRHPLTLSLGATAVLAAGVVAALVAGAAIGAGAGVIMALLVVLIVFALASGKAREDFFRAYAEGRGLARDENRTSLPPTTPLLRKGDRRYAEHVMNGTLPGGLPGALALYTYEEHRRDSDGNRETDYYRFTVAMHDLPEVARRCGDVYCQRRSGFRFMDSAEDVFRSMQRLELESEALDKRYEIFFGKEDSENWMKQLFSPSFIVWLADEAPKNLAFEFSGGSLCVNVKGHHDNAAELDELCEAAAAVARRLAEEAAE
jgi:hypothetical protein